MNLTHIDLSVPVVRWAVQTLVATGVLSAIAFLVCRLARSAPLVRLWSTSLALFGCLMLPGLSWMAMQRGVAVVRIPVVSAVKPVAVKLPVETMAVIPDSNMYVDDATSTVFDAGSGSSSASSVTELADESIPAPRQTAPPVDWRPILILLYGLGVTWSGVRLLLGTARLAKVLRSSGDPEPSFLARLENSGLKTGRLGPFFTVRTSDKVTSPLVAGVLRPSLIFPAEFGDSLTAEEMRQILAHEEAHAQGRHALFGLLYRTATIVHWFNPFVHFLANDLTQTLEELCDNAALAYGSPSSFARLLVRLAEGQGRAQLEGLALGVLDDRISLERRVRGLLDPHRRTTTTMKPHTRFAVVGTAIVATLLLAGTQLVSAQSAWDDIAPSVKASPSIGSAQAGPRTSRATKRQERRALREARRAGKARRGVAAVAEPRVADGTAPRWAQVKPGEPAAAAGPAGSDPFRKHDVAQAGGPAGSDPLGKPEVDEPKAAGSPTGSDPFRKPDTARVADAAQAGGDPFRKPAVDEPKAGGRPQVAQLFGEPKAAAAPGVLFRSTGARQRKANRDASGRLFGTTTSPQRRIDYEWTGQKYSARAVQAVPGVTYRSVKRTPSTGARYTTVAPTGVYQEVVPRVAIATDPAGLPATIAPSVAEVYQSTGRAGTRIATPARVQAGGKPGAPSRVYVATEGQAALAPVVIDQNGRSVTVSRLAPARTGQTVAPSVNRVSPSGVAIAGQAAPASGNAVTIVQSGRAGQTTAIVRGGNNDRTVQVSRTLPSTAGPVRAIVLNTSHSRKPVTVISGATVVIYDDGTTVVTKAGRTKTIRATTAKLARRKAATTKPKSLPKRPTPSKTTK